MRKKILFLNDFFISLFTYFSLVDLKFVITHLNRFFILAFYIWFVIAKLVCKQLKKKKVMLIGAWTLVKEANIVTLHWNLCNQLIKSLKSISFNPKKKRNFKSGNSCLWFGKTPFVHPFIILWPGLTFGSSSWFLTQLFVLVQWCFVCRW